MPKKLRVPFFKNFLLLATVVIAPLSTIGQVHNSIHDTLRVRTVYDIADLVTWPDQASIDTFEFGVLSKDERLHQEFQKQTFRKVHEKPVRIRIYRSLDELEKDSVELLFLQQRGNWDIEGVKKGIEGEGTLLIAENYPFYQTMISFIFQEGGTRYLVFRKPFLEKGFSYEKALESLAIIKTQADWKRAFKATEGRLAKRKRELRKKSEELKEQKEALKKLQKKIKAKQELLKEQRKDLQRKKDSVQKLKSSMQKQEAELAAKRRTLKKKAKELQETRNAIEDQQNILAKQKEAADSLQKHISRKKERIQQQKGTLKAQDKRITYQTYALVIFGILIMVILGFAYLLRRNYKRIKSINQELEQKNNTILQQNERIEEKNKEITESITYASKIQHAMLPSLAVLQENFQDNGVLYIPRDIVSGDFYWAAKGEGKIIWTASDCTGHGVPGAMMSMLGIAFLREVVTRKGIYEPNKIMDQVRDMIVRALSSDGGKADAKDGMDMGLCTLEPETGRLEFAGANNPLYLIHNGNIDSREFPEDSKAIKDEDGNVQGVEIKADKQPVGANEDATPFKKQVVEVRKGDRLHMFSDGYADQFGGNKGKKLKYKPFKRLLLESGHLSLHEQSEFLRERFDEWKGNFEQVDDVVVLSVEI
ncbi:MAG: YfiR/HmsC family protein [Flavobacteriales bacterium]